MSLARVRRIETLPPQNFGPELGELLPGFDFEQRGTDQRRYPATRYESSAIRDSRFAAFCSKPGRERRHLHVAADDRRANLPQRHEFDLAHVVEYELERAKCEAARLRYLEFLFRASDDPAHRDVGDELSHVTVIGQHVPHLLRSGLDAEVDVDIDRIGVATYGDGNVPGVRRSGMRSGGEHSEGNREQERMNRVRHGA